MRVTVVKKSNRARPMDTARCTSFIDEEPVNKEPVTKK